MLKNEKPNFTDLYLGIELGSTRIKGCLINSRHSIIAIGEYNWNSYFKDNNWTYDIDELWFGIQSVFKDISSIFRKKYNSSLTNIGGIGISAMMHGYLAIGKNGKLLVPFRTWQNTYTKHAAKILSEEFKFNVPHRWSISHLYHAILNNEDHIRDIRFITTLAGYVHWKLTDCNILGAGDASGLFPLNEEGSNYNQSMLQNFSNLITPYDIPYKITNIIPKVKLAGDTAGKLTKDGAKLLDPSGILSPGIEFCPPEGDAGTGMVATNTLTPNTGNISAGTSIFSMIVLNKSLRGYYEEVDIVHTPNGKPVAMIHCNNFTKDLNEWVKLFHEFGRMLSVELNIEDTFKILFNKSQESDSDIGNIVHCNYTTGEPITNVQEGRPLFIRQPNSNLNISNFIKSNIYASICTLKLGMDILLLHENINVKYLVGHGGFFKTENIGQQSLADALNLPIYVMQNSGEGGPFGMALLAAYKSNKNKYSLESFLKKVAIDNSSFKKVYPIQNNHEIFLNYLTKYTSILNLERDAGKYL